MSQTRLDRRRVLSGGLALASACVVAGRAGAVSPMEDSAADRASVELEEIGECEIAGMSAAEAAARHAPFRAAFLAWLGEASGRLALPCFGRHDGAVLHRPACSRPTSSDRDQARESDGHQRLRAVARRVVGHPDLPGCVCNAGAGWFWLARQLADPGGAAPSSHTGGVLAAGRVRVAAPLAQRRSRDRDASRPLRWGGLLRGGGLDIGATGPRRSSRAFGKAGWEQPLGSGTAAAARVGDVAAPRRLPDVTPSSRRPAVRHQGTGSLARTPDGPGATDPDAMTCRRCRGRRERRHSMSRKTAGWCRAPAGGPPQSWQRRRASSCAATSDRLCRDRQIPSASRTRRIG